MYSWEGWEMAEKCVISQLEVGSAGRTFQLCTQVFLWAPPAAGLRLQDAAAVLGITSRHNHAQRRNRDFVFQNQENPLGLLAGIACTWLRAHSLACRWQGSGADQDWLQPIPWGGCGHGLPPHIGKHVRV